MSNMRQLNLFSWKDVENLPDLERLRLALDHLPDQQILQALDERRGKGRNDYPVSAMWRATVAGVVLQHKSIASLVRELHRNPSLLGLCGFNPLPLQPRTVTKLVRDEHGRLAKQSSPTSASKEKRYAHPQKTISVALSPT